jgi:hypothetical protein
MAYSESKVSVTMQAGQDLSGSQYRFVALASDGQVDPAGAGLSAVGVLQNDPAAAGRAAEVAISGVVPVEFGGVVTIGLSLASDAAGKAVAAAVGDQILGVATEAGGDGTVGSILFQPRGLVPA